MDHSNKGPRDKIKHNKIHGHLYKWNEFDSVCVYASEKCVYASEKCVPIHPRHQLLNCMDCVERDALLFVRIGKIFATSLEMFRYQEIVYVVTIFLEDSLQVEISDE
jgi:hypothetical protein